MQKCCTSEHRHTIRQAMQEDAVGACPSLSSSTRCMCAQLNHYKVLLALSKVNVESWDPNYPHLCRLPAEAPAASWSRHLQRAASESETANNLTILTIGLNICSQPHAQTETLKGKRMILERLGGWPETSKRWAHHLRWSSGIMLLDGLFSFFSSLRAVSPAAF